MGLARDELSLFRLFLLEGNPFEMHAEHKEEDTEDVLASNGVSVCTTSRAAQKKAQRSVRPDFDASPEADYEIESK